MVDYLGPALGTATKSITSDIYISAKRWFAALDPRKQKLVDYRAGLSSSLGYIQIMGMPSARKLETIYVGLRAVPEIKKFYNQVPREQVTESQISAAARNFLSARHKLDVDKFLREMGYDRIADDGFVTLDAEETEVLARRFAAAEDSEAAVMPVHGIHALQLIEKHDRLVVLGHPGSGKTTFLKYLALAYAGHLPIYPGAEPRLPIFVPLRELKRVGPPTPTADWLQNLALSCAQDISTKSFAREWLEDALQNGRCIVLLDGIDEIPLSDIDPIVQSIRAFATKFRLNKFVVSCRVASFERSIEGFSVCEIDEFNESDVKAFLKQWFGRNTNEASRLEHDIKSSSLAKDLCKTPLLLTLICILYGYRRSIPENRAELYEACVDALLFRWDTFRAVDRQPILKEPISPERKKLVLSRIAAKTFSRGNIYFNKTTLLKMIRAELDAANFSQVSELQFLQEIESHNGMLIEHAVDIYCFSHLTFQEFFVSLYYHDTKNYADLFQKTIRTPAYNEIFLMTLEKMYNADRLVMQIVSHIANSVEENNVSPATISLAQGIVASNASINPKLKRALQEALIEVEMREIEDQPEADDEANNTLGS